MYIRIVLTSSMASAVVFTFLPPEGGEVVSRWWGAREKRPWGKLVITLGKANKIVDCQ